MTAAPCRASWRNGLSGGASGTVSSIRGFYAINAALAFSRVAAACGSALSRTGPKPRTALGQAASVSASSGVAARFGDQVEVGFVVGEQAAVDGFFRAKTEGVEPAAAQAARLGQPFQCRQQPGAEGDFPRAAVRARPGQPGRGQVEAQAQVAVEAFAEALAGNRSRCTGGRPRTRPWAPAGGRTGRRRCASASSLPRLRMVSIRHW